MNVKNLIGRFAIDANLDNLQDVFDIEDALDMIMGGLIESKEVSPEVWAGLELIRDRLDEIRNRSLRVPYAIQKVAPDTHRVEETDGIDNQN